VTLRAVEPIAAAPFELAHNGTHVTAPTRRDIVALELCEARRHLVVPNGYTLTATASLGIVEHLLRGTTEAGFRTPSQLMGAEYVLSLPGVAPATDA